MSVKWDIGFEIILVSEIQHMIILWGGITMKFKIGFSGYEEEQQTAEQLAEMPGEMQPVKSVVQVRFPSQGRSYSYYNDRFDLHVGDIVFVEGKLEGVKGIVTELSRTFKIRLSDYKRVIAVADTEVKGRLYFGGSHLIAFDKDVIPYDKIRAWFLPPESEEEYAVGCDDESVHIDDPRAFGFRSEIAERGFDYYNRCKVVYISVDGESGRAIVEGSRAYELTFDYFAGEISNLTCGCFCSYHCKHEFAILLQLRETLRMIEELYDDEYGESDNFAAISKSALLTYAMDREEKGSIVLE